MVEVGGTGRPPQISLCKTYMLYLGPNNTKMKKNRKKIVVSARFSVAHSDYRGSLLISSAKNIKNPLKYLKTTFPRPVFRAEHI